MVSQFTTRIQFLVTLLVSTVLPVSGCFGPTEEELKPAAWEFTVQSVTAKLGYPEDLTFPPDGPESVTPLGNHRYQITSFAEYANEKGENSRSYFFGTVVYSDKTWNVERLKFADLADEENSGQPPRCARRLP